MSRDVRSGRSFLFVPGDRPDRFDKAATSGADALVLDLEDAVSIECKDQAREHVRESLEGHVAVVRINGINTPWHDQDVAMVAGRTDTVMLPKAEYAGQVDALRQGLPTGAGIIPLLETATGIVQARQICQADHVVRPAFGSVDLATQLGIDHQSTDALQHARSTLVLAVASAECSAPIDGVTTALNDTEMLRADSTHARSLGFTAKLCIHPQQVVTVNETFLPSTEEIEWARRVVDVARDGAATTVRGQMIDRPVVQRAEAILDRA